MQLVQKKGLEWKQRDAQTDAAICLIKYIPSR